MAAVGTVVVTTSDVGLDGEGRRTGVTKYSIAWTCDASGNVSGNGFAVKVGSLQQFKFIPGAAGAQPTDQYDATFVDTDALDVLSGNGANLSNATPKLVVFSPPIYTDGSTYDLTIANAGNAKSGTAVLWVK